MTLFQIFLQCQSCALFILVWYGMGSVDPEGSEHEVQETLGFQSLLVGMSFRGSSSLQAHTILETLHQQLVSP